MSGLEIHQEPAQAYRMFAPCAPVATATWDVGDPVQIITNQLSDCIDNLGEIVITAIIGFACEPAEGIHAGSRVTRAADGFGVVENQMRSYWPFDAPGLLLRTRNFYDDGAATNAEKEGTEIGDIFGMIGQNGTNVWGLEEAAPGAGTDAEFQVVAILDADMNPVDADSLEATHGLDSTTFWLVFRPVRQLQSQLTEGGA